MRLGHKMFGMTFDVQWHSPLPCFEDWHHSAKFEGRSGKATCLGWRQGLTLQSIEKRQSVETIASRLEAWLRSCIANNAVVTVTVG